MPQMRIVLKPGVSREKVGYLAYDRRWHITSLTREGESPQRQVWATRSEDTVITFLEDPHLALRYVVVEGARVPEVADALRSSLDCWTTEEALDFLMDADGRDGKIHGIYLVAAAAPVTEDPRIARVLTNLAQDPDPDVRCALLFGIAYLAGWPTLRAIAESAAGGDPDRRVRRNARHLLEGLDLPDGN